MENNDASVAGKTLHDAEHFVGCIVRIIVVGKYIPEIDDISLLEERLLLGVTHTSVWRTEEVGMENLLPMSDIIQVLLGGGLASTHMMEGMVAYGMSLRSDTCQQFGITLCVLRHHEEGSPGIVLTEDV